MHLPTIENAEAWLGEGARLNPGPWVAHSRTVTQAAQIIAQAAGEPDPAAAHLAGLLHDIGRRAGFTHLRHTLDGWRFLCSQGFPDLGEICLTHSFPDKKLDGYFGEQDVPPEDIRFLENFLAGHSMTPLDRLIQLCDSLALPEGYCLLEKRFIDVALRYGTTVHTAPKWRAIIEIQKQFEARIGASLYTLLPGVERNTFGI